jgi:hypothetical protein
MPHRVPLRWWIVPVAITVLTAHLIVPGLLSHVGVGVSVAIASGLVMVVVVTHFGFGAVLVRSLWTRFRQRG